MNGNFANQSGFAIPTGGISFTPAKYVRIRRNVSYDEMAAKARQGVDAARCRAVRLVYSDGIFGYALAPAVMGAEGATTGAAYTVGFLLVKAGGALIDNMAWLFAIGAACRPGRRP